MGSEDSKDGGKGANIVRGRLRFLGGEVDVALIGSDKDVIVSATRFHGQLTGEVRSRGIVARNSTDEGGGRRSRKEDGADQTKQRGKGRGAQGA